jgi:hypothetical protein
MNSIVVGKPFANKNDDGKLTVLLPLIKTPYKGGSLLPGYLPDGDT